MFSRFNPAVISLEVIQESEISIRPGDIDLSQDLSSTFGKFEVEKDAVWVVKFLQHQGNWNAFKREDMDDFYRDNGGKGHFRFNGLIARYYDPPFGGVSGGLWLIEFDGMIFVTKQFIEHCYSKHPVQHQPTLL